MKVSIITVCKNVQDTIEETIRSVLSQTYKNIEYIIIDGESTDETLSIIDKYRNKIDYLVSEQDSTMYEAMNKGIKAATGDVLFFLNADDIFYDKLVIENVVDAFSKTNADILYGNISTFTENTGEESLKVYSNLDKLYFLEGCICQQAVFYRAEAFKKIGLFDQSFKITGDYEWLLRALIKNRLSSKYINMTIARFRWGGLCNNDKYEKLHREERDRLLNTYYTPFERKLFLKIFRGLVKNSCARSIIRMFPGWGIVKL